MSAAKEDPGDFVYAIPSSYINPKVEFNPYDLQVVSPHRARACNIYYTASASNITRVSLSLISYVCLFGAAVA